MKTGTVILCIRYHLMTNMLRTDILLSESSRFTFLFDAKKEEEMVELHSFILIKHPNMYIRFHYMFIIQYEAICSAIESPIIRFPLLKKIIRYCIYGDLSDEII